MRANHVVGKFANGTSGYPAALVQNAKLSRHAAGKRQLLLDEQNGNSLLLI
jgi:hypothetical protein